MTKQIKMRTFLNGFISDVHKPYIFLRVFFISGAKKEPINSLIEFLLELAGGIEPPTY